MWPSAAAATAAARAEAAVSALAVKSIKLITRTSPYSSFAALSAVPYLALPNFTCLNSCCSLPFWCELASSGCSSPSKRKSKGDLWKAKARLIRRRWRRRQTGVSLDEQHILSKWPSIVSPSRPRSGRHWLGLCLWLLFFFFCV